MSVKCRERNSATYSITFSETALATGNASNFLGTDRGPKIFAIISGHAARLTSGDKVWLRKSPTSGKAGAASATTSARTVGY
jgi:hypothetical protein